MERKSRIEYLKLKELRNKTLADVVDFFSAFSNSTIMESNCITIEEMNALKENYLTNIEKLDVELEVCMPYEKLELFNSILNEIKSTFFTKEQYFSTYQYYNRFWFKVNCGFVIENYETIIYGNSDDIYIFDALIKNSIKIEPMEEHWDKKEKYFFTPVLKIRGVEWIDVAINVLKNHPKKN